MNQPCRLPSGGSVDRTRPLGFTFDGRPYTGLAGDTLASALLANGVHLVGRSFKYHRPRGIVAAGVEEPNALVMLRGAGGREDPNTQATRVALTDGLRAESQNRWPSLAVDAGAINDWLSPVLPAGFYYKTFLWPARAWHRFYEPRIRARAGLGPAPTRPDPDRYAQCYAHCDVLVVGAGAAGLAAARAAARDGRDVMLCDENEDLGTALLYSLEPSIHGLAPVDWRSHVLADLARSPNVRLLPRTTAFGYYAQNFVGLVERCAPGAASRERLWQVRASRVVLATGAIERPLVFADNDRPGVMLASAVQRYVGQYAVLPGRRVAVCAVDDSAYEAAAACRRAGADVTVLDARERPADGLVAAAVAAGIVCEAAAVPTAARGGRRVRALEWHRRSGATALEPRRRELECDLVLLAGGWTPAVHLHSQARGALRWDEDAQAFLPAAVAQAVESAGSCRGVRGLDACAGDGAAAALGAADRPAVARAGSRLATLPAARDRDAVKAFVDFQNDVTARDVRLAVREGFASVEHVKRYTTLGMATDQGRTSNLNGLTVAAEALGREIPQVGLTTFRAPYTPVTFGTLVGAHRGPQFEPVRRTPLHERAQALGAVFENVGAWQRARYFPQPGEDMHAAVRRECRAVRTSAGLFDASTLGKIEVVGPDAAEFMNRMYTNAWSRLEPGRCRYGVMLREDGFVMDDGVVGRLSPERFHVTTTTGGAPRVLHHMEDYLQTEFTDLRVWLTSTTEQWAVLAVQGPRAREVLAPLVEDVDLAPDAFPHMAVRTARICGAHARLFRVSFTGELGYEVNVPPSRAAEVWEALHDQTARHGGAAYGTEAMHVLRAEKGYIIVGQETDGTVTPDDVGLGWAVGASKRDFVGKRSLQRPGMAGDGRKQLVGLLTPDRRTVLEEGAQLLDAAVAARPIGHVTSAYDSVACERPIALALLRDGRHRIGSRVRVTTGTAPVEAEVVSPVFYDPENRRLAI